MPVGGASSVGWGLAGRCGLNGAGSLKGRGLFHIWCCLGAWSTKYGRGFHNWAWFYRGGGALAALRLHPRERGGAFSCHPPIGHAKAPPTQRGGIFGHTPYGKGGGAFPAQQHGRRQSG